MEDKSSEKRETERKRDMKTKSNKIIQNNKKSKE